MIENPFFTAAGIAAPTADQQHLVAAYLMRLAQRCDRWPLAGTVRLPGNAGLPPTSAPSPSPLDPVRVPVREAARPRIRP